MASISAERFDRQLALRVLTVVAVAVGIATSAGLAVGFAVYFMILPPDPQGFDSFGAVIFGSIAGSVVALATGVPAVVTGVRRVVPDGRHLRTAAGIFALPVVLIFPLGFLSELVGDALTALIATVVMLACLAAGLAAVLVLAGALRAGRST